MFNKTRNWLFALAMLAVCAGAMTGTAWANYSEDWEGFADQDNPGDVMPGVYDDIGTSGSTCKVLEDATNPAGGTKVLRLTSKLSENAYQRLVGSFPAKSGTINVSYDTKGYRMNTVRIIQDPDGSSYAAVVFHPNLGVIIGNPADDLILAGTWNTNNWYHVDMMLYIDPDNGDNSTFDVAVYDMENGNALVGSITGVDCTGSPTQVNGVLMQNNALSTTAYAWGMWDNITVYRKPVDCAQARGDGWGLQADLNQDCHVEWADFGIFASQWQQCMEPDTAGCTAPWD